MSTTIYKVIYVNEMLFCQERNFTTQTEAESFAETINSWYAILQIVSSDNITQIVPEPEPEPEPEPDPEPEEP